MANVLIAGGSGLVGSRLSEMLTKQDYEVAHLSRRKPASYPYKVYQWNIEKQWIEQGALDNADYVINLAGAGIVDKRWTKQRKRVIIESRTQSTRLLSNYFKKLAKSPKAYISSAAIGYYGDRGNSLVDESSVPGEGFLAKSCIDWENAIQEIVDTGIRTAWIRIGIVMSKQGGAMPKMLIPFYFLMGTYFGDGQQWYSWIHIDDLCQMFIWAMENEQAKGIYNGVSPQPLTNKDLTIALGRARDQFFIPVPAPAFVLKLAMGEMSSTILNSTKVASQKIENAGFTFEYPEAVNAIKDILKRGV